jgi:hypothetical protein
VEPCAIYFLNKKKNPRNLWYSPLQSLYSFSHIAEFRSSPKIPRKMNLIQDK